MGGGGIEERRRIVEEEGRVSRGREGERARNADVGL